jgi:hypothetical protein
MNRTPPAAVRATLQRRLLAEYLGVGQTVERRADERVSLTQLDRDVM